MTDGVTVFSSVNRTLMTIDATTSHAADSVSIVLREQGERGDEQEIHLNLSRLNWQILTDEVKKHL